MWNRLDQLFPAMLYASPLGWSEALWIWEGSWPSRARQVLERQTNHRVSELEETMGLVSSIQAVVLSFSSSLDSTDVFPPHNLVYISNKGEFCERKLEL